MQNTFFGSRSARRGMALPVVIVVILVLSASLAGGVMLARGERVLDDAGKSAVFAQSWAETGMQRLEGDRSALGFSGQPGASDSIRVTVSGMGYYDVVSTRLRTAVSTTVPGLYLLRSHAVITRTGVASGPNAEFTVTKLATWKSGTMTVQSALTGVNGTDKSGASGDISGVDQCGASASISAVAGPTTAADGGAGYDGMTAPLSGATPLVQSLGSDPVTTAAAVPIDWAGIIAGTAMSFDFTSDGNGVGFPSQSWFDTHPTSYPTIFVNNGPPNAGTILDLDRFGRGLLVIYDDIWLNGNTAGWDGILLVGGRVRSNGGNAVSGATVSGLNTKLGYTPQPNDVNDLNGTKQFLYDSCKVSSAVSGMGSFRSYKATWSNTFKVY